MIRIRRTAIAAAHNPSSSSSSLLLRGGAATTTTDSLFHFTFFRPKLTSITKQGHFHVHERNLATSTHASVPEQNAIACIPSLKNIVNVTYDFTGNKVNNAKGFLSTMDGQKVFFSSSSSSYDDPLANAGAHNNDDFVNENSSNTKTTGTSFGNSGTGTNFHFNNPTQYESIQHRNDLINQTHDLLHNVPIGSMSKNQINQTKSLIYQWYSSFPQTSNTMKPAASRDIATIMESLLERLIEEHDEGFNEDAYLIVTTKDYNVVMNAYGKSVAQNQREREKKARRQQKEQRQRQRMLKKQDNDNNAPINTNNFTRDDEEDEGIIKVEALFQRMKERYETHQTIFDDTSNGGKPDEGLPPKPNIITYNTLLSAYSNQFRNEKAVQKAEKIMKILESGHSNDDSGNNTQETLSTSSSSSAAVQADTISYNSLMNIYANQVGEYGYAQKAEDILLNMSKIRKEGSDTVAPNTMSFNTVLKAWKNSGGGSIESAKRAEEILRIMLKLYSEGHEDVRPDGVSLSTVINAYIQPPLTLNEEILGHFDGIIDLLLNKSGEFLHTDPDTVVRAFNTIIDIIGKSNIDNAGDRANDFLQKLIDASSIQLQLRPNIVTYSNVIGAYIKDERIEDAVSMLHRIIDGDMQYLKPDAFCFNKCLTYYCKKRNMEAAEDLFKTMNEFNNTNVSNESKNVSVIDVSTYNMMMGMYVNIANTKSSKSKEIMEKTVRLLEEMEDAYQSGIIKSIDSFPYEAVLERFQKRSVENMKSGIGEKSYDLFMKMVELHFDRHLEHHPDRLTSNLVLSSLAREFTEEAAEKAMLILDHMEQMHAEGKSAAPDEHSFSHVIVCWLRSGAVDATSKVTELLDKMEELERSNEQKNLLSVSIFETILRSLSRDIDGNREEAKLVLERMISLSKQNKSRKPSPTCLNLVLKAECTESNRKNGEMAAFDAHRLLFRLIKRHRSNEIDALPDVIGFNTVISCWANTQHKATISKAEEIFEAMEILSKHDGLEYVKPDSYTFSTMMNVYAKSSLHGSPKKAEALIKKIKKSGEKIDTYTYNGLLNVWARSRNPRKAINAQKVLENMLNTNVADVLSFNTVLKACAYTRGSEQNEKNALEVAEKTYNNLLGSKEIRPNYISFATATKATHNLAQKKEQRERLLKKYFDDCCRHGVLCKPVVKEMKNAIPAKERLNVLGHDLNSPFERDWIKNL